MFTLVKNNDCNGAKVELAKKSLSEVNTQFIDLMNKNEIKNVNLSSFGNSIATGFSFNDSLIPLLKRNEDLVERADFDLNLRAYSRAQDNCDGKTFHYLNSNITQAEINKFVRNDYLSETVGMFKGLFKKRKKILEVLDGTREKNKIVGLFKKVFKISSSPKSLTQAEIKKLNDELLYLDGKISDIKSAVEKYYPLEVQNDIGMDDLIKQSDSDLANIVVYNGFTGSFLDNVTRGGQHKLLGGFKIDEDDIYASLKKIYDDNPNTQVYLCGMPNITGINLVYLENRKLKRLCKKFPNCVYVGPTPQHLLYSKDGKLSIDIHYNNEEYLNFNINIMQAIVNNYDFLKAFTKFDLFFKKLHDDNDFSKIDAEIISQYGETSIELRDQYIKNRVDSFYEKFFEDNSLSAKQLKIVLNYCKENYDSYFYINVSKYKKYIMENLKNTSEEKNVDGIKTK